MATPSRCPRAGGGVRGRKRPSEMQSPEEVWRPGGRGKNEYKIKGWETASFFRCVKGKNGDKILCEKGWFFGKRGYSPIYIIVSYIGYFFNVFSPEFSIFFDFSFTMSTRIQKTPFWGNFEGKTDPFFVQMG